MFCLCSLQMLPALDGLVFTCPLLPVACPPLQVSRTARLMVTQLGFVKSLGQVAWSSGGGQSFLGQQMGQPSDFSAETADQIDREVKALVERAYRRAKDCLQVSLTCP